MREKLYTKEPWEAIRFIVKTKADLWITQQFTGLKSDGELKANAHLISATPELLKELERHCEKCRKEKALFDSRNDSETLKYSCKKCATRTAIAKAYGETP